MGTMVISWLFGDTVGGTCSTVTGESRRRRFELLGATRGARSRAQGSSGAAAADGGRPWRTRKRQRRSQHHTVVRSHVRQRRRCASSGYLDPRMTLSDLGGYLRAMDLPELIVADRLYGEHGSATIMTSHRVSGWSSPRAVSVPRSPHGAGARGSQFLLWLDRRSTRTM